MMDDYKVQLEVFEGPLDLLLYLIKKEEVDIYEVNLTKIASQFIEYVERMRQLDLDIAGEFLVMAATLMFIKSRELLPVDLQTPPTGEEEEWDPRWDLIRQLVEYKKFKDMAGRLQEREADQEATFTRQPAKPALPASSAIIKPDVTLFDLINAVSAILRRFQNREQISEIYEDRWTVSEKIEYLITTVTQKSRLRFSELFLAAQSRNEVIATFLALLELIRLKQLAALQAEPFGEIEIGRAEPPPAPEASLADAVPTSEPA